MTLRQLPHKEQLQKMESIAKYLQARLRAKQLLLNLGIKLPVVEYLESSLTMELGL